MSGKGHHSLSLRDLAQCQPAVLMKRAARLLVADGAGRGLSVGAWAQGLGCRSNFPICPGDLSSPPQITGMGTLGPKRTEFGFQGRH